MKGPDQEVSIDFNQLSELIKTGKQISKTLGNIKKNSSKRKTN